MINVQSFMKGGLFIISVLALGTIIFNNFTQAVTALESDRTLMLPFPASMLGALVYTMTAKYNKEIVFA